MKPDTYLKGVLTVIAVALAAIAVNPWLSRVSLAPAEAQTAEPKYLVTIPKAWGKITSFSNNNFLMEAPDGTLRVVDVEGKAPEYPRVKVQAKVQ
jgi:hypothetical protein